MLEAKLSVKSLKDHKYLVSLSNGWFKILNSPEDLVFCFKFYSGSPDYSVVCSDAVKHIIRCVLGAMEYTVYVRFNKLKFK